METQSFPALTRHLLRLRRGVSGALLGGTVVLLTGAVLRLLSLTLPPQVWALVPLAALTGWLLRREPERELLWAGRRLGVGGRLAALQLLHARGEEGLAALVRRELAQANPRWIRLFSGRGIALAASIVCLAVAAFLLVPSPAPGEPTPLPQPLADSTATATSPEPESQAEDPSPQAPPQRMEIPDELAATLPFQDLLAEIYGLAPGEGPWASGPLEEGIQAQQGLLRRLSQELSRLAPDGLSQEEKATLLPLIQQVPRQDLRQELLRLVERGDEGAAEEAAQAVEAVRRAGEELAQAAGSPAEASSGPPEQGQEGEAPAPEAVAEGGGASDVALGEELRGEERAKEGELAGLAPGESGTGAADAQPEGAAAQPNAPQVRPGEGPARGYLAVGVPVEPEGQAPVGSGTYSPQAAELVLRGQGVPLELRGVVRRYFEMLAQGGNR